MVRAVKVKPPVLPGLIADEHFHPPGHTDPLSSDHMSQRRTSTACELLGLRSPGFSIGYRYSADRHAMALMFQLRLFLLEHWA
jgi:hypothetical protein